MDGWARPTRGSGTALAMLFRSHATPRLPQTAPCPAGRHCGVVKRHGVPRMGGNALVPFARIDGDKPYRGVFACGSQARQARRAADATDRATHLLRDGSARAEMRRNAPLVRGAAPRAHAAAAQICTRTGARPCPHLHRDRGSPLPHLHRDRTHPCHICTGTGLTPATSAPGSGSPLPHLHRDRAQPRLCAVSASVQPLVFVEWRRTLRCHALARPEGSAVAFAPLHVSNCEHGFIHATPAGEFKICKYAARPLHVRPRGARSAGP
jgi:hypothetical protein